MIVFIFIIQIIKKGSIISNSNIIYLPCLNPFQKGNQECESFT